MFQNRQVVVHRFKCGAALRQRCMAWELRLRGARAEDGETKETRAVKEELAALVQRLRTRGHHMEVVLSGPDGSLDVYDVRPVLPTDQEDYPASADAPSGYPGSRHGPR